MRRSVLLALALIAAVLPASPARAAAPCNVPTAMYPTIQAAEDDVTCDPIVVAAGTFSETVLIDRAVTITGAGAEVTIVDGEGGLVFDIDAVVVVSLRAMTITGGSRGVENGGTTTIEDAVVRNIVGDSAIFSHTSTTLNVHRSTIRDNVGVSTGGGGIRLASDADLTVVDSMFTRNHADVWGGAIGALSGTVTVRNSTLSGNTADVNGGGFSSEGATFRVINSTITNNEADADMDNSGDGGGFVKSSGEVILRNSIVAGNRDLSTTTQSPDCHVFGSNPVPDSEGHNIVGSTAGCPGFTAGTGDLIGTDPQILALGDYGGPTLTHSPTPGSPAIDLVAADSCSDGIAAVGTDQRGIPRPQDGDGNGAALCDAGSVEYAPRNLELDARNKVKKGKKVKLNAEVTPCLGHEGDVVHFMKKSKEIAATPLDADCTVSTKSRVKRKTTYTATLDPEADHPADSDKEKVKIRKPR